MTVCTWPSSVRAPTKSAWDSTRPGAVVSVAEIDMSLPQSDRQAYGQEMTSAVPVAMETWGDGDGEPGLGI